MSIRRIGNWMNLAMACWLSVSVTVTASASQDTDTTRPEGQTAAVLPDGSPSVEVTGVRLVATDSGSAGRQSVPEEKGANHVERRPVSAGAKPEGAPAGDSRGRSITRRSAKGTLLGGKPRSHAKTGSSWYADGLIALVVVLAMIAAASLAVKKWGGKFRIAVGGGGENLEVVSRLALSPKQSVCLIRMGSQLVLTGVTPDQISSLAVIDDPETVAELLASTNSGGRSGTGVGFGRLFSSASSSYDDSRVERENPAEIPLATDDGHYIRARTELSGLLDKVRSRGYSVEAGEESDDGSGRRTIAIA